MAKTKYQPVVCDGEACKEIGKAKRTLEQAKNVMSRAMKKKGKRKFKHLPKGRFGGDNAVRGEVWETQRGKKTSERPVYVGAESYGELPQPGERRPRRRAGSEE
jgi:hypothetical protein